MKKILLAMLFGAFVQAQAQVDHSQWTQLLQQHVSNSGQVDYEGFKASKGELDAYLDFLASNPPQNNWAEEYIMSYWINAYNAFTVKLILDHYPLKSIMSINDGKAWDLKFIEIGESEYSLNQIEHEILRKRFGDPRIHFAVNCASVSCPKLHNEAFEADQLFDQLEKLSREFINNSDKNNLSSNPPKISKLFEWYQSDFTKNGSLLDFINRYAEKELNNDMEIQYMDYNWNLNN